MTSTRGKAAVAGALAAVAALGVPALAATTSAHLNDSTAFAIAIEAGDWAPAGEDGARDGTGGPSRAEAAARGAAYTALEDAGEGGTIPPVDTGTTGVTVDDAPVAPGDDDGLGGGEGGAPDPAASPGTDPGSAPGQQGTGGTPASGPTAAPTPAPGPTTGQPSSPSPLDDSAIRACLADTERAWEDLKELRGEPDDPELADDTARWVRGSAEREAADLATCEDLADALAFIEESAPASSPTPSPAPSPERSPSPSPTPASTPAPTTTASAGG
ncbi:hypothetical protein [Demequina silvatica]|uniref:hypothetical protein n=1 Tax=Demequina silvatica TaxID=1638988 RepID=UPI000780D873|nr:hypothetical protein [Demequina silvatica]